jgi:hypothetical protein
MLRAIIKDGLIYPLDPLPPGWTEGQEVEITGEVVPPDDPESVERWYQELARVSAELADPRAWTRIDERLAEVNRRARERVRRPFALHADA